MSSSDLSGALFRCSVESRHRGDQLAGTASTVRRFVLVEHPGPWGVSAVRDAPMPDGVRAHLSVPGARTLLIRRHGRQQRDGVHVMVADVRNRSLRGTVVPTLSDVLTLDLSDPQTSWGEERLDGFVGVCTHGRHDACCAERGRPVAATLAAEAPAIAWEVSHLGGDRFAGNVVVLPEGLYYGRVEPVAVPDLLAARAAGRIELSHLRGRTDLPMAAQFAEVDLRRRLDLHGLDEVRFRGTHGDAWAFDAAGERHHLWVEQTFEDSELLTCQAAVSSPVPRFRVVAAERSPQADAG